ncbi:bifunctional riboflavin kinase/FAD synthetase [Neobacillus notoginsengisoli]|uniref:Riboflavin biosynthesis protein n=1 Tax=Neobacillus notoginsengisoli TaxID=1578198 RepID=A0A417YQS3_9BACI|nr:bifunctional riboflavin kinase/FAD synthetase [Neobacillus notoginsengisoli]RHW36395.1 bifunctional riboflavin kinase/FAD synthetase [Neobacillus notoginsengisoli]
MEVIRLGYPHYKDKNKLPATAAALGYFDGVHLGHQKVIGNAMEIAREKGLESAVMTFYPHPKAVLGQVKQEVKHITPLPEKISLIEQLGVDYLFIIDFSTQFASLTPQEFVDQYIIGLNIVHVSAGFDYTYGRMGKGTMETLPFHSRGMFSYATVEKLAKDEEKVSSTKIRGLISNGLTDEAKGLLGRPYTTAGIVAHGDKRGRTIGFPTANIEFNDPYVLPSPGVYAVRVRIRGTWYYGVCNVGYRPTFEIDQPKRSFEVHIFHFNDEIYGEQATIEWHKRLREEKKFLGIEELVAQISLDKQRTAAYFGISGD